MQRLAITIGLLLLTSHAHAQGRVSIEELTVDGDPPPDEYRTMLANGIRPQLEDVRTAYGRRLAERPGLSGDYRLRLWVSAREVVRITPESSIGDETLERQTREAIYRFRLPPEAPDGGAWVRFVVRFVAPTSGPGSAGTPPVASGSGSTGTGSTGTGTGSTGSGSTGTGSTASGPTTAVPPLAVAPTIRLPTLRVDRIRGALADTALTGVLPVPALTACVSSASGDLPVAISIDRRGRVSASPGRGTLRHRATIQCIERAIESLTLGPEAGPTRARITITIPAATP